MNGHVSFSRSVLVSSSNGKNIVQIMTTTTIIIIFALSQINFPFCFHVHSLVSELNECRSNNRNNLEAVGLNVAQGLSISRLTGNV